MDPILEPAAGFLNADIELDPPNADVDGAIIQHVVRQANVTDCEGNPVKPRQGPLNFYEAWTVKGGKILDGNGTSAANDSFGFRGEPGRVTGTIRARGKMQFIPNYEILQPPWFLGYEFAEQMPVRFDVPEAWDPFGGIDHLFEIKFDCCCGVKNTVTEMLPYAGPVP